MDDMNMNELTSPIRLKKKIIEELKKCKKYPRETYNDQIKRLIEEDRKKLKK